MEHVRMLLSGNGNPRRSLLGIEKTPLGALLVECIPFFSPLRLAPTAGSLCGFWKKRTCFQSLHVPKSIAQPSVFVKRIFHFTGKTI